MEKRLGKFGLALLLALPLFVAGFGWFGVTPMTAFTPTGYATISATTASASAVLGTNGNSVPPANMVIVTNVGANAAYINLGTNTVTATVAGGFPVAPNTTARISLGSATYAAAITSTGTASVSFVTGY